MNVYWQSLRLIRLIILLMVCFTCQTYGCCYIFASTFLFKNPCENDIGYVHEIIFCNHHRHVKFNAKVQASAKNCIFIYFSVAGGLETSKVKS